MTISLPKYWNKMAHVSIIVYLLAFGAGIASITASLLLYVRYRRRVIFWYALMQGVMFFLMLNRMAETYLSITGIAMLGAAGCVVCAIKKTAFMLGMFSGPAFAHHLVGVKMSPMLKKTYFALGFLYAGSAVIEVALNGTSVSRILGSWIGLPLLFGMMAWCMLLGGRRLGTLGNRTLENALKVFFTLALVGFPIAFYSYIHPKSYLPYYLENPLLFFSVSILSLVFAIRYFDQPTFLEHGSVTDAFRSQFSITERESEVVKALIDGRSNNEIAERLFLSNRTVESHLYNIFQKTGVKNRVQLVNLLLTNQRD